MSTRGAPAPEDRITRDDLEQQLRNVTGEVNETATEFGQKAVAAGAVAAALIILLVFLLGRSRGKRQMTVVEIVRV